MKFVNSGINYLYLNWHTNYLPSTSAGAHWFKYVQRKQKKTHPKFDVALGVEAPLTWPIQNKAMKFVNSGINYLYLNWRTNMYQLSSINECRSTLIQICPTKTKKKTHPKFDVALGVEAPLTWPIQNKAMKFVNSGINYLYLSWHTNYLPSTSAGAHWFKYVQRKPKETHPEFDVALGVEAPLAWPIQNKAMKFVNSGINYLYLNWRTNYLPSTSTGAHWFKYVQRKPKKNTSQVRRCLRSGGAVDLTNPK